MWFYGKNAQLGRDWEGKYVFNENGSNEMLCATRTFLDPYKFHGSGMKGILFCNFARCELLTATTWYYFKICELKLGHSSSIYMFIKGCLKTSWINCGLSAAAWIHVYVYSGLFRIWSYTIFINIRFEKC